MCLKQKGVFGGKEKAHRSAGGGEDRGAEQDKHTCMDIHTWVSVSPITCAL